MNESNGAKMVVRTAMAGESLSAKGIRQKRIAGLRTTLTLFLMVLLISVYYLPKCAHAFDAPWDSGHNTTENQDPDDTNPPDDDTSDEDDDQDDENDDQDDEDEDDDDEEDDDDDCEKDCNNKCKPDAKKSPVYVKSGNLELLFTDLEIAGIGPSLKLARSYNSHDKYNGPFGYGWVANLTARLIRVYDNSGETIIIRKGNGRRLKFKKNASGLYEPLAASVTDTLTDNGNGTFSLNCQPCSVGLLRPAYEFDTRGNVESILDTDGNSLNFTYDAAHRLSTVTSSASGRSLTFAYNADQKVAGVTDSFGRQWTYQYDSEENLTSVIDPLGFSILYQYDLKHRLLSVTNKSGKISRIMTYDDKSRVKTIGSPGKIYTYSYQNGYTTKTDPLGNVFKFYYDSHGNVTKTILPDGSEVITVIDDNVNPTSRTDANGNTWTYTYNDTGQILTETSPLGFTTTYTYDPRFQKVATMTDARGGVWSYTYNDKGNLTKTTDPLLCETGYTYDAADRILTKVDGLGYTYTNAYDAAGNLISVTDPNGNVEGFAYDALGRMVSRTDKRGNIWHYTYDLLDRLIAEEDPYGNHKSYTYDGNGNRLTVTDRNGHTTTYAYDTADNKISESDPLGNITTFTYDAADHLVSTTDPMGNTTSRVNNSRYQVTAATDALGNTTTYTYDASGNRLTKTNALSNSWTYIYDAMDQLLSEQDPLGNTTAYEYDATGNRTKVTDPLGKVTYFEYDAVGNLIKTIVKVNDTDPVADNDDIVTVNAFDCLGRKNGETNALGQQSSWTFDFQGKTLTNTNDLGEVKSYVYDANGNKLTHTTVTGNVISYTYDKVNRLVTVGDTTGLFESYAYDAVHNRTMTTTVGGDTTTVSYTAFNKPATVTDALGNSTLYTYDANHNLITVVDRLAQTTSNEYDGLNRLVKNIDPLGNASTLTFNSAGNLITMTDAKGNATSYTYDAANQMRLITYADGFAKEVTYNAAGKITSKTDQNGNLITYERDDLYRITRRVYPDASSYDYTYDKLGRILTATNAYGMVSLTYDTTGRITAINQNGTIINYSHDTTARTRTVQYPGGPKIVENYSLRDKIASIEDKTVPASPMTLAAYTYDAQGRPATKTMANGMVTSYGYNVASLVTDITLQNGVGADVAVFQYGYDAEGNRLYTSDSLEPSLSEAYSYDGAQRLTDFKRGVPDQSHQIPTPSWSADYTLDGLSNWTGVTRGGTTEARTVNAMNQYTTVAGVTYIYDQNGNLIDDGAFIYTYDYENQLTRVTRQSDNLVVASFTIDALNRRVAKTVAGVTTEYIYDDSRIIQERQNGVTTAYYVFGNQLDEPILMHRNGADHYYHADLLGSTRLLTDSAGQVEERYRYSAYGLVDVFAGNNTPLSASAVGNPYLFTGRRYDRETGLYYYRARYMNPRLGRFMNPDPKGFVDGMNLYAYALSNPTRYVDPRGTKTCNAHTFTFNADLIKKYLPSSIGKKIKNAEISGTYKKCKDCCPKDSPKAGQKVTDKELSLQIGWSGDTGYISTPWGIGWDIDLWLFQSKGFIGLVAKVSWGISGSLAGGTENCYDRLYGKGCINGSLTLEALFGVAEENPDAGYIKAYVSGGVTGTISLCIVVRKVAISVEGSGNVSGTVKGVVGVWKFTYERTFFEISKDFGPWVIYKI